MLPSSGWGAAGCCGKLGVRPGHPASASLCARQSSRPVSLRSYFQRQLGDKMRNRRRQDGEMNGKVPRLCVFTRPAASPPGLLSTPARGLCSQQGCRAGLRSRKKPSAPQLPPDASRPHTCPAGSSANPVCTASLSLPAGRRPRRLGPHVPTQSPMSAKDAPGPPSYPRTITEFYLLVCLLGRLNSPNLPIS